MKKELLTKLACVFMALAVTFSATTFSAASLIQDNGYSADSAIIITPFEEDYPDIYWFR